MKEKPLGMRMGESVFCAGYLVFVMVAVVRFAGARESAAAGFATACALMALLLGAGDAFHLVPRILGNIKGAPRSPQEEQRQHFWLGLGNLVSSCTMTIFYVLLFDVMAQLPGSGESAPGVIRLLLVCLCAVRIGLCLFPQNRWFDGVGSQEWGLYRNAPFVAMGALTVLYLLGWYHAFTLALLVSASFACYMGVVLYARKKPALGMLMMPKTICYIALIALLLARLP